jgi:hypothetical protein
MKVVTTFSGTSILVDDADFELVSVHKWRVANGYAITTVGKRPNRKTVLMHRLLTGMRVDHKNRNRLDNQRHNLRPATQSQNMGNRSKSTGKSSQFKGVSWNSRYQKWQTHIRLNGKSKNLGMYTDETQAAEAYNEAAVQKFKEFALLN